MVSVRVFVAIVASSGAAACAIVAGLPSEYELAPDASVAEDGATPRDAADASADVVTDATADVDAADAAIDAPPDVDDAKPPKPPPSDPANVACGATKCPLPMKVCCEQVGNATCQDRNAVSCGNGVVADCDEAANCPPQQVCCVTDVKPFGLETKCGSSCTGGDPQACRKDGECPSGQTCVAWTCNGRVVATCNGLGSDAGCN